MFGQTSTEIDAWAKDLAGQVKSLGPVTKTVQVRHIMGYLNQLLPPVQTAAGTQAVARFLTKDGKRAVISKLPTYGVDVAVAQLANDSLDRPTPEKGWPLWAQIVVWGVGLVVVEEVVRYVFFRRKD